MVSKSMAKRLAVQKEGGEGMRTLIEIVTEAEKMLVEFEAKWREVLTEGAAVMQAESHAAGRAEGRRDGLLEAAKVCELTAIEMESGAKSMFADGSTAALRGVADAIRADALIRARAKMRALRDKLATPAYIGRVSLDGSSQESGKDASSVAPPCPNIHGGKDG